MAEAHASPRRGRGRPRRSLRGRVRGSQYSLPPLLIAPDSGRRLAFHPARPHTPRSLVRSSFSRTGSEPRLMNPRPQAGGEKIGPYILRRKLGEGAMGVVWLAVDPKSRRDVAVKLLQPEYAKDERMVGRFLREA